MKSESKTVSPYGMSHILHVTRKLSSMFIHLLEILNIENDEYKNILSKGPTTSPARCLLISH